MLESMVHLLVEMSVAAMDRLLVFVMVAMKGH